jgi:hypothetical protein
MNLTLGFSPPSITEGNKMTLIPPLVFQGDFSKVSSGYFILFGILQDFTAKMLEIAFQGL